MNEFDCIIQIETVKNVQTIKGGERMLLEERLDEIVKIVNERGSISNQELVKMFGASESTIRRDITTLANDNRVIQSTGGAMVGCIGRRNGRFGSQCKTYLKQ